MSDDSEATGDGSVVTSRSSGNDRINIRRVEMEEHMQTEAIRIAIFAFENYRMGKDVADYIKKMLDDRFGPTWHCIVGRDFGASVTHLLNHFIHFHLDERGVLIFKSD